MMTLKYWNRICFCQYFNPRVTPATCLYTAMHGCYGLLWLAKEALYRDASWETPCTLGSAVLLFFGMQGMFWSSPYLLVTGGTEFEPLPHHLGLSLTCFIIGNWLHHSADVQKYFVLRARRGLIMDGFFLAMSESKLPRGDVDLRLFRQHGAPAPLLVVPL